jgi:hypothetical protein
MLTDRHHLTVHSLVTAVAAAGCVLQFLCDGLEEDMTSRWEAARAAAAAEGAAGLHKEVEALTRASGKMLLLHKLLPKLRAEGRQVGPEPASGSHSSSMDRSSIAMQPVELAGSLAYAAQGCI